jgi:MoaA/NifB/PqqE/SkfB family radical SAM enzyme
MKYDSSLYIGIPDDLTLQLSFNNNCNCYCKFCCEDINREKVEIIPKKWLYEDLLPLYPKTANLVPTYGEITAQQEGYEYILYIHKNYPEINITVETNGIAFSEKWAKLSVDNLMRVNFSLNAINESMFLKTVWDKKNIYPLIEKNLCDFLRILKKNDKFAFKPSISMVVNESNYQTIVDFIKLGLEKEVQIIVLLVDNNLFLREYKGDKYNKMFEVIFVTLMEIERLIKDKVFLNYKLFVPINNLSGLQNMVNKVPIEDLMDKYSDIVTMIKNFKSLRELYNECSMIRKEFGKKPYSYKEFLTGSTFHQKSYRGNMVCANPWNHLRLRPNGDTAICSWYPYLKHQNIKNYMKGSLIDFDSYFNSEYRRFLRLNFRKRKYDKCMLNCPAQLHISEENYNKEFDSSLV